MKPLITVFTPTFNRAGYLRRLYESLLRQSDRRFMWLIVDDGSTDSTRETVGEFISRDNGFEIRYEYKENGGLHTAYNRALEIAETELFVCIDSDDFLTDGAIEHILSTLPELENDGKTAGLIAPDVTADGNIIGGKLPECGSLHLGELKYKYRHTGDVKMIYKTAVLKKYAPIPVFDGEKVLNPVYLFLLVDKDYKMKILDYPVSIVDYSSNGMHTEVFRAYQSSPFGFAELRRAYMRSDFFPVRAKFRNAVHYVSSCIFAHEKHAVKKSPCPVLTLFAVPLGAALNIFIRLKNGGKAK